MGLALSGSIDALEKNSEAGNNLIMDEIHTPGGGIPFRMAPLVLLTTVLTHLFGGSAGREGTAVQMGGSTAEYFAQKLGLGKEDKRILLMAGMAAGFGAVFGTPVTGAIFALEVLAVGRIKYDALLPCLFASLIADITCNSLAVHHTHYAIGYSAREAMEHFGGIDFDLILLLKVLLASACFGLASFFFCGAEPWAESTLAGFPQTLVVAAGAGRRVGLGHQLLSGYLGLSGTRGLFVAGRRCLHRQRLRSRRGDVLQLVLEATLNRHHPEFRLQGGEVTPLFFIGATLGNALAVWMGAPIDLLAGLGFIAVFAGATNTPLACTLMGVELFGAENLIYYAIACFTAYYFSGHSGIYGSQRVAVSKFHTTLSGEQTLKQLKAQRNASKKD